MRMVLSMTYPAACHKEPPETPCASMLAKKPSGCWNPWICCTNASLSAAESVPSGPAPHTRIKRERGREREREREREGERVRE